MHSRRAPGFASNSPNSSPIPELFANYHGVCKIFVLCSLVSGHFERNIGTTGSGYFALGELPELSGAKNTVDQVRMCFEAYRDEGWIPPFD